MIIGELCLNKDKAPPPTVQLMGMEMEAEDVHEKFHGKALGEWRTVLDGSLRNNGLEFVSKPLDLEASKLALIRFYNSYHAYHFESNERTSMHVHLDMRTRTGPEVLRIIAAYCLMEPLVMAACGAWREENIYCVPFYRTNEDLDILRNALDPLTMANISRTCKYSALYAEPLQRFGTLEFRQAPLWNNEHDAKSWLDVVTSFARVPLLFNSMASLTEFYNLSGPVGFAKVLFGDSYDWLISKTNMDLAAMCESLDVERQASMLASAKCGIAESDWTTDEDMQAPPPRLGALPTMRPVYRPRRNAWRVPEPARPRTTATNRLFVNMAEAYANAPPPPPTPAQEMALELDEAILEAAAPQRRTVTMFNLNTGHYEIREV